MNKYVLNWYKFDGTPVEDVESYVKNFMDNYPNGTVTIGCDSQEHAKYIKYSVSICMHMVDEFQLGHGGHVIACNITDRSKNAKQDIYTKLFAEAELSVQAAKSLNIEETIRLIIHLDYNSKPSEYSHALYSTGLGYVRGMFNGQIEVYGKPDAWVASSTSDKVCKNKQAIKIPN